MDGSQRAGVVRFGDLECDAVVLLGGERGYVRRELAKLLGIHQNNEGRRFSRLLAEIAPNTQTLQEKIGSPILLPSGQKAQFFPAGIIPEVATGVVSAAPVASADGPLGSPPEIEQAARPLAVAPSAARRISRPANQRRETNTSRADIAEPALEEILCKVLLPVPLGDGGDRMTLARPTRDSLTVTIR